MNTEHDVIVLRIRVDGIRSVELLADESSSESQLRVLWSRLEPIFAGFFAAKVEAQP